MSEPSIIFDNVSKRFSKGFISDSLRDALIKPFKGIFSKDRDSASKENNEFWALKDVSFEVKPGEVLGIIGPNGSGKSTSLKLLSRILRPDQGRVLVNGRVGAMIELGAGFNPDLTGKENVFLNGSILGMKKEEIQERYDEIVEFAGIQKFMDMPVKWYSSGMYARLGFATAAHTNPQVLLVDEVLSVGDISFQKKCIDKMHKFKKDGIPVVFISHNMQAIASLCTKLILLKSGVLISSGPTEEVLADYLKNYGSSSKNGATGNIILHNGLLFSELGDKRSLFKSNEKGYVEFCIGFKDDFQKIYVSLFVRKKDGTRVFGLDTTRFFGKHLSVEKGQNISFKIQLTFNLVPGEYVVGTSVFDVSGPRKELLIYSETFANVLVEDSIGYYGIAHLEPKLIEEKIQ